MRNEVMTHEDEERILLEIVKEEGKAILQIGTVYSDLREAYNNKILEIWEKEWREKLNDFKFFEANPDDFKFFPKINRTQALQAFMVIDSSVPPQAFESVERLIIESCNPPCSPPGPIYQKLTALNEILEGHGIEHFDIEEDDVIRDFYYINMGGTYDTTVLYDIIHDYFFVSRVGDVVETFQK